MRSRRIWIGLILLCGLAVPGLVPQASAQPLTPTEVSPDLPAGFSLREFHDGGQSRRYCVYVPPGQPPASGWPVLMFLHGAGQRGSDGLAPLSNTLACAIEADLGQATNWPLVTIFPQCQDQNGRALTGWVLPGDDAQSALRILQDVEKSERIDPRRRILSGWSMGGYGAWSLAAARPDLWSRVLILSGGAQPGTLDLQRLADSRVPVWSIHGQTDPLIPASQSVDLIRDLQQRGGSGHSTVVPGIGHDVWRYALADRDVLDWLKTDSPASDSNAYDSRISIIPPLPSRSRYFLDHLAQPHHLLGAVAMRASAHDLAALSRALKEEVNRHPEKMSAGLPDVRRRLGNESAQIEVSLTGLRYSATLDDVQVHVISGGRLGVDLDFRPLRLEVSGTELSSEPHWARTGSLRIEFGAHRPARLHLELQPYEAAGRVRLRLLRQEFLCDAGNWYITPPTEIEVRSPSYTPWHISTGLVGSLYLERDDIVQQVLQAAPELVKTLENQMQAIDSPQLARLLSPLPVVTPELRLSPRQLSVFPEGVTGRFDVQVLTQGQPGSTHLLPALEERSAIDSAGSTVDISLAAITEVSRLNIQQDLMRVNVLDISDAEFARLTDPGAMAQVFPSALSPDVTSLRTVLRLMEPLCVQPAAASGPGTGLILSTPGAALEVWSETVAGTRRPLGRIVFDLEQPVTVEQHSADGDGAGERVTIRWSPDCRVRWVKTESLDGAAVAQVNAAAFETLFKAAWQSWARENGSRLIDLSSGAPGLQLRGIEVDQARIRLRWNASSN